MKKLILALPVLVLLFTACSGIKTSSDYDKAVDFSNYQSFEYYGWDKGSDQLIGAFDKERIEKAFAEEFDRRNLKQVEKLKGGDLIVTLFIVTQNKSQKTATTTHIGMGRPYGYHYYYGYGPSWGWGPSMGYTEIHTVDYKVGTLMCSVFDAKNKQLIWQGAATKTIEEDLRMRGKSIPYAVKALMRSFPIKPVKK